MSMGHEVVGHWFNEEVKDNLSLLDEVEQAARTVKRQRTLLATSRA